MFTEKGWKVFESRRGLSSSREDAIDLSSEDEGEPVAPAVRNVALILQESGRKIKLHVLEVSPMTFKTLTNLDRHDCKVDNRVPCAHEDFTGQENHAVLRWRCP